MMPLRDRQTPATTPDLDAALRRQLESIISAVEIESELRFRFADLKPVELSTPPDSLGAEASQSGKCLIEALEQLIYNFGYAREFTGTTALRSETAASSTADAEFLAAVSAAHESRPRWDPGWQVFQVDPSGSIHVEKGDTRRLLQPGEFACSAAPGRAPTVGDAVAMQVHRESTGTQPGFYFSFGESVPSDHDDAQMGRFYVNVASDTVPWLTTTVSRELNALRVPYRMKCLSNPAHYCRTDPAVLYVAKRFVPATLRALAPHRAAFDERLRAGTPLFTKPLARGVGVGDEPGGGQSFGQVRSKLVAKGVVDAWRSGSQETESRIQAIHTRFEMNGLSLSQPHLNEGTADLYQWPSTEHQS